MNKLTRLYDSIHMPVELEPKILNAPPARKPKFGPAATVAAVFIAVLMLGMSPTVRAAVGEMLVVTFPELGVKIYEKPLQDGDGGTGQIIAFSTYESTFAEVRDGRLYFTGNNEDIDITDQISEEQPFYYTYSQDKYEITLIVGYDGTIENFGTHAFVKADGVWFTGSGKNYLDRETETAYPWVAVMWQDLDIPWPMPG